MELLIALVLLSGIATMSVCCARSNAESVTDSVHGRESQFIGELIVVDMRERGTVALIIEDIQLLVLSLNFILV